MTDHCRRNTVISYYSVFEGPRRRDTVRGPSEHFFGLGSNRYNFIGSIDGHYTRLVDHNTALGYIYQNISCTEVDGNAPCNRARRTPSKRAMLAPSLAAIDSR